MIPLVDYHTRGVIPVYRGGEQPAPRVRGFPYKKRQTADIISKLWKDVRDGRIASCSAETVSDYDKIICAPPNSGAKKLRIRPLPPEMRLISGVRRIKNFGEKLDYPTWETQLSLSLLPW